MFREVATLVIDAQRSEEFEARVKQADPLFQKAKGCHGMTLHRVVETPGAYHLVVEWETVENHMVDFRESADFQRWRDLVGEFFVQAPAVIHTSQVI